MRLCVYIYRYIVVTLLASLSAQISSLENTLNETENRNSQLMGYLNNRLLRLEEELGELRAQMERQAGDYDALLNIKMKLEVEIAKYRHLLEGLPGNDW